MKAQMIIDKATEMGINAELTANKVDKGNGVVLDAISVRYPGSDIAANVYYAEDDDVETVVERIRKAMEMPAPNYDIEQIGNYENVKGMLTVRLYSKPPVGAVARKEIADLYVVPSVLMNIDESGTSSFVVTESITEKWGVEKETIINDAIENAKEITPATVKTMTETLIELLGIEQATMMGIVGSETDNILVVSNKYKINGAAAILYVSDLPSQFYMLPSSKHEVLVVPKDNVPNGADDAELVNMVRIANATEVPTEDVLSNNAYYYDNGEWYIIA